jgi:hypothetical protein
MLPDVREPCLSSSQETKNWWKGSACRFPDHTLKGDGQQVAESLRELLSCPSSFLSQIICQAAKLRKSPASCRLWPHQSIRSQCFYMTWTPSPAYPPILSCQSQHQQTLIQNCEEPTAFLAVGRGATLFQTSFRWGLCCKQHQQDCEDCPSHPHLNKRSSRFAIATVT